MNEKELKRLEELEAKDKEKLTDDEVTEIISLREKKSVNDQIKAGIQSFVREAGLAKLQKDVAAISQDDNYRHPGYVLHKLLIAAKNNDRAGINDLFTKVADPMTEGTPADGGYLVPAVTRATIAELIPTYGQARQYMQQVPMGKAISVTIPKELTNPTIAWLDEGAIKTPSKPTLGNIVLTAKKAAGIVVLSDELLDDAIVSIGDYIIRKFAQAFGVGEDQQFFNGTGSPMTGVFSSGNTFGNTVTLSGQIGTLGYQNLLDAVYGIDQNYLAGAAWYFSPSVLSFIRGITDGAGRFIFTPTLAEGTPGQLLGYPVRVIQNAPASNAAAGSVVAILGNLNNSFIGTKQDMTTKVLTEATIADTSLAQYDLTAFRVVERVAFAAGMTGAYSAIKLAAV